ncbi:MAG: hypothetical protein ACRDPA_25960 [Solirubrobacteraceae bacterium]
MNDQLPPSLIRFGREYERASRRELSRASRRRTYRLAGGSTAALAAIAATVVLVLVVTTGATPAYALIKNSDGTVTVSLRNLTTGISQLNARLERMGIDYTVIPVTQNCPFTTPVLSAGPGSLSETVTIGTKNTEPSGVDGYLAAEQLPDGLIGLGIGGMKTPLPACLSPRTMTVSPSPNP